MTLLFFVLTLPALDRYEKGGGMYDGFIAGLRMNANPQVTYTSSFVLLPSLLMYMGIVSEGYC